MTNKTGRWILWIAIVTLLAATFVSQLQFNQKIESVCDFMEETRLTHEDQHDKIDSIVDKLAEFLERGLSQGDRTDEQGDRTDKISN